MKSNAGKYYEDFSFWIGVWWIQPETNTAELLFIYCLGVISGIKQFFLPLIQFYVQ